MRIIFKTHHYLFNPYLQQFLFFLAVIFFMHQVKDQIYQESYNLKVNPCFLDGRSVCPY